MKSVSAIAAEFRSYCTNCVWTVQLDALLPLCYPPDLNLKSLMFHLMSCNHLCHMPGELLTLKSISPFLPPSAAFRLCDDESKQALTSSSEMDDSSGCCLGNAGNAFGHHQKRTLPLLVVLCWNGDSCSACNVYWIISGDISGKSRVLTWLECIKGI